MSETTNAVIEILVKNNWVPSGASLSAAEFRKSLEAYADFHGLNPTTPDLADLVVEHAKQPRCRHPDRELNTLAASNCKWPHKNIRFWHDMTFANVPKEIVDRCWKAAIESWRKVCGIQPVHVTTKAESNIFAHAQRIDGGSNVLAWSMLPCGVSASGKCEQRYDLEPWERYGKDWSGLQEVMAHEIGHALGLDHARAGNLMQPFATFNIVVPQAGDIAEVQSRYGPPVAGPVDPGTPPGPVDPGGGPVPPPGMVILGRMALTPMAGRKIEQLIVDYGPIS